MILQVWAASREGHLPATISYVSRARLTPLPALLFLFFLTLVFMFLRDISQLLNMYMVAMAFFYGQCMLALLVLRRTKPLAPRPFKVSRKQVRVRTGVAQHFLTSQIL